MGPSLRMGSKNGKPVLREEDITQLASTSGLDRNQVVEHFDAFKDEHPDGRMNKKEFKTMMSKALPKKDASKMEKHVFRVYDTNADGFIDFVEFMVLYYVMADGTPEEVLLKIFRIFDINSDGVISKKELTRLVKDMYGMIQSDSPDTVRILEIVETFETVRFVTEIFKVLGKNAMLNGSVL